MVDNTPSTTRICVIDQDVAMRALQEFKPLHRAVHTEVCEVDDMPFNVVWQKLRDAPFGHLQPVRESEVFIVMTAKTIKRHGNDIQKVVTELFGIKKPSSVPVNLVGTPTTIAFPR